SNRANPVRFWNDKLDTLIYNSQKGEILHGVWKKNEKILSSGARKGISLYYNNDKNVDDEHREARHKTCAGW
ncbi:MAG: hypothetical protein Q4E44_10375, partial [bacterium]|nr:hypothetical protein [bacterium]